MCNNNQNQILNIDFSSVNDETNWIVQPGDVISTQLQRLNLKSSDPTHYFERTIGTPDPSNNRLKFNCVFDIIKTVNNTQGFEIKFEILNVVNSIVFECSEKINVTNQNEEIHFSTDRLFQYNGTLSELKLRIKIIDGIDHTIKLKTISVDDFFLCLESIKTYFVLDNIFESSFRTKFGTINLNSWKEDSIETLTLDFINDNNSTNNSEPLNDWNFCESEIDGTNRLANVVSPISWNPFSKEFGLDFSSLNYFDGKPTGTTNGNDYGQAIMKIGIDKPLILNGSLIEKFAPFFIDFDFTKDVEIEFDVILSDDQNIFNNPFVWRKYFIKWNKTTCRSEFYYLDKRKGQNTLIDQTENGFLFGLNGTIIDEVETNGNGFVKKLEIIPGDCDSFVYPVYSEVWIQGSGINYIPQIGDVVYLNSNFTQVFDGSGGFTYRMRNETTSPFPFISVYTINSNGIITTNFVCLNI